MRNIIKIVAVFGLLILIFVLFWTILVSPGFPKLTQCFNDSTKSVAISFEKASSMTPGTKRNQYLCSESFSNYQELVRCLKLAKKNHGLSFTFYTKTTKFEDTFDEVITTHNNSCPETPISFPNF